jgi:hypothetical protein
MVEIHLYGGLRRHAARSRPSRESVVRIAPEDGETVAALLARTGIAPDEVYHVFLNGALLATHNTMATWLAYHRQDRGLDAPVLPGDRIGVFGRDMPLLVV